MLTKKERTFACLIYADFDEERNDFDDMYGENKFEQNNDADDEDNWFQYDIFTDKNTSK